MSKERNFLCEIGLLLVRHAQVRCKRIGRPRVKEIQTSSENRNHRHVTTTQLRAQIVVAEAVEIYCSEVRSLYVDRSSSSSDVISGSLGRGRPPSRAWVSRGRRAGPDDAVVAGATGTDS